MTCGAKTALWGLAIAYVVLACMFPYAIGLVSLVALFVIFD